MRPKLLFAAMAAASLLMVGCDFENFGDAERYQRDFHASYPLKPGGRLSVETFNGSVDISGWDENTVDISGVKYGPTQDLADSLKIDMENTPDAVSIRAVRPSDRRGNLGARFTIRIPRSAILDRISSSNGAIRTMDGAGPARLRTSNGQIRVQNLKGSLDAQTSNGSVELTDIDGDANVRSSNGHIRAERLHGSLEATTSNSSINAHVEESARPVRLDTSNGSVEVTLPPRFSSDIRVGTSNSSITLRMPDEPNARVIAHTSNSSITSDFEIRMLGSFNKNHMEGTLGAGGNLIDLGTSNGSIRLLRM
jgi:DUF4097 and DUF4098 domain-containing protein YvlB